MSQLTCAMYIVYICTRYIYSTSCSIKWFELYKLNWIELWDDWRYEYITTQHIIICLVNKSIIELVYIGLGLGRCPTCFMSWSTNHLISKCLWQPISRQKGIILTLLVLGVWIYRQTCTSPLNTTRFRLIILLLWVKMQSIL